VITPVFVAAFQVNVDAVPLDEPIGWVVLVLMGLAVLVGPWILLLGVRRLRKGYTIYANDPVDAGGAHLERGVVEVEGSARSLEGTLTGTYSGEPAVAQTWRRERKQEETDDDGNTNESWRTVSRGSDSVPFLVEDQTGSVAVDPSGANLSIGTSEVTRDDTIRFGNRDRTYREYEGRIEPGDTVHVYGQLREDDDAPGDEQRYIGGGSEVSEFVVSDGSELRTVLRYAGLGAALVLVALVWIPVATAIFLTLVEAAFGIPVAPGLALVLP